MKTPYLKKNLRVRIVSDYRDTQFLSFVIKFLRETGYACSYVAQVESFKQNK